MTNRIADLRSPITTPEQARDTHKDLALAVVACEVADARLEQRIARLKAQHAERTGPQRQAAEALRERLSAYINNHREQFKKPRTVKSEFGEFGLRTATELLIADEPALVSHLMEQGYTDCFETVRRPIKPAIKQRLNDGESVPGCSLNSGDTIVCKISKALIDEATEDIRC